MKIIKWIGYIVGGLLVLILAAVGTVYAITAGRIDKDYPTQVENVPVPSDPAAIERGRHLVQAVGKCTECHGANLAGGTVSDEAIFAKLTAPNLTAGKNGVGGTLTDADWVRAIRYGVRRDGKPLLFMPSEAYTSFSDADLGAIIAYLKTLPPADMPVEPARSVGPIGRFVYLTTNFPLIPAELIDRTRTRAAVTPGVTVEYGRYLAETGGCTACHTPSLGGQKMGDAVSSNLTRGGPLKSWTEADFIRAIRTGTRPDGTKISEAMPWKAMATLTDDELRATWLYITSLPPVTTVPGA